MIQTQTRVIDGLTVQVSQMPAMKALRMSARLGKLLGAPLAKAVASIDAKNLTQVDVGAIGAALASLFENITDAELEDITRQLLASATVDGAPMFPAFDVTFAGKVSTVYKLLGFALEVNYGSFFDVLRALGVHLGGKQGTQPSNSDQSMKSSGPPGA